MLKSPQDIYNELSKSVVGQDDAKKSLSIVIHNHLMRYKRNVSTAEYMASPPRLTLLITGPTGSGKTSMVSAATKIMGLPFYTIDATSLVPHGGDGSTIADYLKKYHRLNSHYDNYNYGIIYIDEIDKLFRYDPSGRDNNSNYMNMTVHSLLSIIDGVENTLPDLHVDKLLFIFSGAFEYINSTKGSLSRPIGYNVNIVNDDQHKMSREDIEKFSAIPKELLARINVITQTYELSEAEIKDVLTNCTDAILPQFESTFLLGGSKLELSNEELDDIVKEVKKSPYGMRISKSILFDRLKEKMFRLKG